MQVKQPTLERDYARPIHRPLMDSNSHKEYYSVGEFMDKLAKKLGPHYGLTDIREAL